MTSMTMVGGLVSPAPQWRLGEIGELLRERMNTKIESLDQLSLYMQRNDADMLYGGRIIAQIDAILDDLRRNGLSRDVAVAVESARPGTIPDKVRKLLTSNYTRTHQKETIVALESWAEAGKIGLVVMVIVAILKMLSWLLSSSSGYQGGRSFADADVKEFQERVNKSVAKLGEELQKANTPVTVQNQFKAITSGFTNKSVAMAYAAVYREATNKQKTSRSLDVAAAKLDKVLSKVQGTDSIDIMSIIAKKSVFEGLFRGYVNGDADVNPNSVLEDAISVLLGKYAVGDAVFTDATAKKVFAFIPDSLRKRGVRVPCETLFKVSNARFGDLSGYFNLVMQGFHKLRKVDAPLNGERAYNVDSVVPSFAEAIRQLNELLTTVIPDVSRKGIEVDTVMTMAMTEGQARNMIGYSEPIEFMANKVLVVAGYESFLNSACFNLIRKENRLSETDCEALLGAVALMANPLGISHNTSVTNMMGYRKLESIVSNTINEIENFSKEAQRQGRNDMVNRVSKQLMDVLMKENPDSLNVGREMTLEYMDSPDFFGVLRKQMGYVRHICRGVIALNRVVQGSNRNLMIGNG